MSFAGPSYYSDNSANFAVGEGDRCPLDPLPMRDLLNSPFISDKDAILDAANNPWTTPEFTPSPTTIHQDFVFGNTISYEYIPIPNPLFHNRLTPSLPMVYPNILSGNAPNTFLSLPPTSLSQTHSVVQSGHRTPKTTKSTTPDSRPSSSQSGSADSAVAATKSRVPKKSDRTYLLLDPSSDSLDSESSCTTGPGGSGAASTWILMEKDTGNPATHLLKEVRQDRFSTWWRLDDGSRSKLMGHWWCRRPGCGYHTRRNADMDDHVLTHQDDSVSIKFNCKTWDGPPCFCSENNGRGFESKYKRSIKRHYIDSKKAGTR